MLIALICSFEVSSALAIFTAFSSVSFSQESFFNAYISNAEYELDLLPYHQQRPSKNFT